LEASNTAAAGSFVQHELEQLSRPDFGDGAEWRPRVAQLRYERATAYHHLAAGTAEIENVPDGLVLLKKQLGDLGEEATVRFGLLVFCRQSDGKVVTTGVKTDAFTLRLPAVP
jgi:hypothetical protein